MPFEYRIFSYTVFVQDSKREKVEKELKKKDKCALAQHASME